MNLDLKNTTSKILPALEAAKKYLVFVFIMVVLVVFGYLVIYINTLASKEPDETAVAERLKTVQRPKIDEDALSKIQMLEDQNIQVQTLFQQARDNPFTE